MVERVPTVRRKGLQDSEVRKLSLEHAIAAVRSGQSIRSVAQQFRPAEKQGERRQRMVELSDHGEVLTSDEVLERLEKVDEEKQRKQAEKGGKRGEKCV